MTTFRFRLAIPALILVSFALTQQPLRAQLRDTVTFSCGGSDTVDLGAVLAGGTMSDTLYINNADTASLFIIRSLPSNGFSWKPSVLISVPHDSTRLATTITFSADTLPRNSTLLTLAPMSADSTVCQADFLVSASVVGPDTNNYTLPLVHNSQRIIGFKSDTTGQTLNIQFENDSDASITLDTLTLQHNTAFRIDSSSVTFPATIPAGGTLDLKLAFIASKPGFYTDYFRSPDQPILPFSVQGLLLPNQAVQTRQVGIFTSIYPNPSPGSVTIRSNGLRNSHIIITDILGRVVVSTGFAGEWIWNGTGSGSGVATGTYFVLVSGRDPAGRPVHEMGRLIIQ